MKQNNFDFLRFYFAFIVVIGHLIFISDVPQFKAFYPFFNTYTSVTGFFIISGFLISKSYSQSKSLKEYFVKRASRLLPAYIFVVSLCAILLSFQSILSFSAYFSDAGFYKYLLANFTFLNFLHPNLPGVFTSAGVTPDVNGALWTLKVEVAFYLSLPVIYTFFRKTNKKIYFLIALYVLSVFYSNCLENLALAKNNSSFSTLAHQLPGFISYFVSGMAVYYYFEEYIKRKNQLLFLGIALIVVDKIIGYEVFMPMGLSLIVFFFAFSFKKLNHFAKYGDISYGIYVFHYPIIKLFTVWGLFTKYNPYLISIVVIAIVLTAGFLSWHLIEKRFLSRAKTL